MEHEQPSFEQLSELHRQASGVTPRVNRRNFQEFLKDPNRTSFRFPSAHLFPPGWSVLSDVAPSSFSIDKLEFMQVGMGQTENTTAHMDWVRVRAISLRAQLGCVDGHRIFKAQADVLMHVSRARTIYLPGTIVADPRGGLWVPCLEPDLITSLVPSSWKMSVRGIGMVVDPYDYVARVRNK